MKHYKNGFLLPMGVIFIFIMVIVGMGILYLGTLERLETKKRINREKAFYLAEAGAYRAYAHLKENNNWEPEEEPLPLGDGTFWVVLEEDENNRLNIISTGTVRNIQERVQITLGDGGGQRNSWSQGIFGSVRIRMSNNSRIASYDSSTDPFANSISSNAEAGSILLIEMSNNSTIYGNASVTNQGQITLYNNSTVTGNKNTDKEFEEPLNSLPPVVIPSELLSLPYPTPSDSRIRQISGPSNGWTLSGGTLNVWHNNTILEISGGDYRFSNIYTSNGILRFTGNVRLYVENMINISNNSKWDVRGSMVIYLGINSNFFLSNNAKVGIDLSGDIKPVLPQNFRVYSASTKFDAVNFSNNSKIAGIFYVPKGRVDLNNNVALAGGLVANILDISNNAKILYDLNLNNIDIPDDPGGGGSGTLRIIRWTKPNWINRLQ